MFNQKEKYEKYEYTYLFLIMILNNSPFFLLNNNFLNFNNEFSFELFVKKIP